MFFLVPAHLAVLDKGPLSRLLLVCSVLWQLLGTQHVKLMKVRQIVAVTKANRCRCGIVLFLHHLQVFVLLNYLITFSVWSLVGRTGSLHVELIKIHISCTS